MELAGAMACPNCGSWSVKADRSLAGRLVCGRCARPLGAAQTPRRQRHSRSRRPGLSLGIGLLALVALAALLAAWDQQRLRFTAPPERLAPNSQLRPQDCSEPCASEIPRGRGDCTAAASGPSDCPHQGALAEASMGAQRNRLAVYRSAAGRTASHVLS